MIHTLTMTHQILSPKTFDQIYKRLEIIRKSEKGIHDARAVAEAAEKSVDLER